MRPLVRRRLRSLHTFFGVFFAAVLLLVAASGAVLTVRPELEAALAPDVEWDGRSMADWRSVRDLAIESRPTHRLQMLWFPNAARPSYTAAFAIDDREYTDLLHFHPRTAARLEDAPSSWLPWLEELHENLHLGDLGAWLVRWCTPALVGLMATGLVLSWPTRGDWRAVGRIRRGRPFLLDTHRISGLVALPFLLAMAFTGAVWSFPDTLEPWVYAFAGEPVPAEAPSAYWQLESVAPFEGAADADAAPMIARALADAGDGAFVDYLSFPIHPSENRQVRVQRGYDPWPDGEKSVYYFDRYTGALLAEDTPSPGAARLYLRRTNAAIHFGTFGGVTTRIVWVASCLALVHLAWSGTWIWIRRIRR
jgi:uncharacterized iron-regulated membrane protein